MALRLTPSVPLSRGECVIRGHLSMVNPVTNSIQDLFHLELYTQIIESKKPDSELLKTLLSLSIIGLVQNVALTINFDCKFERRTIEINDVFTDGFLPMKVVAHHLLAF